METTPAKFLIKVAMLSAAGYTLAALYIPTEGRVSIHEVQDIIGKHESFAQMLVRPMREHPSQIAITTLEKQDGKWASYR